MALATIVEAPAPNIEGERAETRRSRRRGRYEARRTLWREAKLKRVAFCGRFHNGRSDGVQVRVTGSGAEARAGFSGLQSCGNVWACPVCAEKIQAARQAELQAGINYWLKMGGGVTFGTLTLRHNKGHKLGQLLDAIAPAWEATTSRSSAWRGTKKELGDKQRFGIEGFCRLQEIKVGDANGWHPHLHFLLFTHAPLDEQQHQDLSRRMFGRWETKLAELGFSVIESVGIDLRPVADASVIADYFNKHGYQPRHMASAGRAAYEVTSSQAKQAGKGGRTPFELLADMVAGETVNEETGELVPAAGDQKLWREYEKATKGRRQLTWSRGLRQLLAMGAEASDQELVEKADLQGDVVVELTADEWSAGRWWWRSDQLLDAAERGTLRELLAGAGKPPGEVARRRRRARRT